MSPMVGVIVWEYMGQIENCLRDSEASQRMWELGRVFKGVEVFTL